MRRHLLLHTLLLCWLVFPANGHAQTLADEAAFLDTLQAQLRLQYQQYRNRDVPVCALRVQIETSEERIMESSMGGLMDNRRHHQRTLAVRLRVGDPQRGVVSEGSSGDRTVLLPLDFNTQAVGHLLNNEVRRVYALAEAEFVQRRSLEKSRGVPFEPCLIVEEEPDTPPVPPIPVTDFPESAWVRKLNQYSAFWRTFGPDASGKAVLRLLHTRIYTLDHNGLRKTDDRSSALLTLTASLTDTDGQAVSCERNILTEQPEDLPTADAVILEETRMYDRLQLAAAAHPAEAAIAPALFSAEAAPLALYLAHASSGHQPNPLLSATLSPTLFTVEPHAPCTDDQLRQRLQRAVLEQNKEYGYWIKSVRYSETEGLVAQEILRVFADGRPDEPVRGLALEPNPLFWSQITACGGQADCLAAGWLRGRHPVCCCAPAILCHQIETRETHSHRRTRLLPENPPPAPGAGLSFSEHALHLAQEEARNLFADTSLPASPAVYLVEYRFTDATACHALSSMGSLLQAGEQPVRTLQARVLVGSDRLNNENLHPQDGFRIHPLPLDEPGPLLSDIIHQATEQACIEAFADYEEKTRRIDQLRAARRGAELPDRSEAYCRSAFQEEPAEDYTPSQIQELADDLSARLSEEKRLLHSGVDISAYHGHAAFFSSQNVQYIQPFRLFRIRLFAEALTNEGDTLRDERQLVYRDIRDLPGRDTLYQEADNLAETLAALAQAPVVAEYSDGPVLFSNEAAANLLAISLLEGTPSLLPSREPADGQPTAHNWWNTMKQKQVVSPLMSVSARFEQDQRDHTPLVGFYTTDAEGVPPARNTELIHNGKLLEMLSNRTPTTFARFSNGHQRLALYHGSVVAAPGAGVLQVSFKNSSDDRTVHKAWLRQARGRGQKYAYQIVRLNFCRDPEGNRVPVVAYAYRIRTSNGARELVRIARTEPIEAGLLNHVTAATARQNVFNTMTPIQGVSAPDETCPLYGVPTSVIAPEHLVVDHFKILPLE